MIKICVNDLLITTLMASKVNRSQNRVDNDLKMFVIIFHTNIKILLAMLYLNVKSYEHDKNMRQ